MHLNVDLYQVFGRRCSQKVRSQVAIHTVDGRNPAPFGCIKPCKIMGINYLSTGAGFFPSSAGCLFTTVSQADTGCNGKLYIQKPFRFVVQNQWFFFRWNPSCFVALNCIQAYRSSTTNLADIPMKITNALDIFHLRKKGERNAPTLISHPGDRSRGREHGAAYGPAGQFELISW